MTDTTLMSTSSLQVSTDRLIIAQQATTDEVEKESFESDVVQLCRPRYVLHQPPHTNLGLITRPEVPSNHPGNGVRKAQKLAHHCIAHKFS